MENVAVLCQRLAALCGTDIQEVLWALGKLGVPVFFVEGVNGKDVSLVRLGDVVKPELLAMLDAAEAAP